MVCQRLCLVSFLALSFLSTACAQETYRWKVTVREPEGIRRFGHPVSLRVELPRPAKELGQWQLLSGKKVEPIQVQTDSANSMGITAVTIDFRSTHLPFQSQELVLEYTPGKKFAGNGKGGTHVEETDDAFVIMHSANLQYVVPKNLIGLLRSVKTNKTDYLNRQSKGLWLTVGDKTYVVDAKNFEPAQGKILKNGPFVSGLRFQTALKLEKTTIPLTVDFDFPRNRSWVHVTATVTDSKLQVKQLGMGLDLNIVSAPTLIDFGTDQMIYAQIRQDQVAILEAGGPSPDNPRRDVTNQWKVFAGSEKKPLPVAFSKPSSLGDFIDAWAHIMDKQHCTAVGVDDFGLGGQNSKMTIHANGQFDVWRSTRFAIKTLSVWMHFVPMPVHVGAATSPQSMTHPPVVTLEKLP